MKQSPGIGCLMTIAGGAFLSLLAAARAAAEVAHHALDIYASRPESVSQVIASSQSAANSAANSGGFPWWFVFLVLALAAALFFWRGGEFLRQFRLSRRRSSNSHRGTIRPVIGRIPYMPMLPTGEEGSHENGS